LNVGLFINAILQFLIVSFAVFWLVKALTRLNVRQDAVVGPTKTEVLLGEIRDLLQAEPHGGPDKTTSPVPPGP
jgi:large conductance mechanosensitive channel